MKELIGVYREAIGGLRRRAVLAVAVAALGGLVEVAGLAALIPLLDSGSGTSGSSGSVTRWLHELGLSGDRLLWVAVSAFCVLGVIAAICSMGSELLITRVRAQVEERMRRDVSRALLGMEYSGFLGMRFGDLSSSIMVEGGQTSLGVMAVLRSAANVLVTAVFVCAAVVLDWRTTLFTVAFGVVLGLGYRAAGRRAQALSKQITVSATAIGNHVGDVLGNLKYFRSTGGTLQSQEEVTEIFREFAETDFKATMYKGITRFMFEGGGIVFVGAVVALSIATTGRVTAETLVFLALFYRLLPRMLLAQENLLVAKTQSPWYESWRERMAVATTQQAQWPGRRSPTFKNSVALEHVSLTFPQTERQVLQDVSLSIVRGECVALVGESGSGKTTVTDLLTGLLVPTIGRLTVDGVPLMELDLERWQRRIGLVLQDSPVFHASVLDNIAWQAAGSPDRTRAERAATLANACDFIEALPDGLDTVVGERGGRLSGGQRQRLGLARALYREPWLLILDEATSALDSESEAMVQAALEGLKGSCTIVMVAHRLGTVQLADRIIVLEGGGIVEQGSWEELIARGGRFRTMAVGQGVDIRVS